MEKYYNEKGEVGILFSPGQGVGWSTWNDVDEDNKYALALDKRVIDKWLCGVTCDEMKEYLESIGYKDVFMSGYDSLCIGFVPSGTKFYIEEYDGFESILTEDADFCTA